MNFGKLIGNIEPPEGTEKIIHRVAARAILVRNGKILLIHSHRGTYGLPGGGVERGESCADALLREVAEETGYIHCIMKSKIGVVTEGRLDRYEEDAYFLMISHYYLCDLLDDEKSEGYEWEPGTTGVWIEPAQAMCANQAALEQNAEFVFVHRENFVLGEVERHMSLAGKQGKVYR